MRTLTRVIGHASDAQIRDALGRLEAQGRVSHLLVPAADLGRRRFRAVDQHDTPFGVALDRDVQIEDGSVLHLTEDEAVVIDAEAAPRLVLRALTTAGALRLGWAAGHLHWKVRMSDDELSVLLEAPREDYLERIEQLIQDGDVEPGN